ncbi:hypothetical protein QQF73_11580 [Marinobacter sp. M216]|uniref:Uncharacterized protein n=1 Tax=Marinobacter albus TaxID=3030833 RepID=A0ABT7HEB9_9GAMM|nr:hypothetical protein [Marinobacter sp. M216]MDK9558262.1 hypothetical protein [Marinobacter sp. M216]
MSESVLSMFFSFAITPILALWPYFFIRFKKGENQFLFVSAFYGAMVVTSALLSAIAFPIGVFLVKLLPQLDILGLADHLQPFVQICEAIADWYFVLIFPVLYLALPPLLDRRYEVFSLTSR